MAEHEVNVINHLIEVEQNAVAMTENAQAEADKKIALAKTQADSEFKTKFDKIVAECESEYAKKTDEIKNNYSVQIKEYKDKIISSTQDKNSFNKLLDKVLSE